MGYGINAAGYVVGVGGPELVPHVITPAGTIIDLGGLNGVNDSDPTAINGANTIVGH